MSSEVIREFLVSLGFQTDRAGKARMKLDLKEITADAMKLGAELEALAAGAVAAAVKVSSTFEDLYYASQRLNSTATNIRGADFAIRQLSGGAATARGSLEGIANFMRSNPGGERFIANLGVSTRGANGELRDTTEILSQLGSRFRAMPYYAAKVRANFLGIDEPTLQALMRGDLERKMDDYRTLVTRVGIDQEQGAKAAHDFMTNVRTLATYLQLVGEKFLLIMTGPMQRVINLFDQADKATGGWSTAIIGLTLVLAPLIALVGPVAVGIGAIVAAIGLLIDDFATWREGGKSLIDWKAWAPEIDDAIAGIKEITDAILDIGRTVGSWLPKQWAAAFGNGAMAVVHYFINSFLQDIHSIADAIKVVGALLKGDWKGALSAAKDFVNDQAKAIVGVAPTASASQASHDAGVAARTGQPAPAAAPRTELQGQVGAGGVGARIKAATDYFRSMGWSPQAAAGMAANGIQESGLDPTRVGDNGAAYGAFQWHKDRQDAFKKWAGKDIRQSTLAEQLAFAHYELTQGSEQRAGRDLAKAANANDAGAIVSSEYERPLDKLGEMARRGALAAHIYQNAHLGPSAPGGGQSAQDAASGGNVVHIQQDTNINLYGDHGSDAGKSVAREQDRVNSDLLRNAQGALQ